MLRWLLRRWLRWLALFLINLLVLVNVELDALLEDHRVFVLLAQSVRIALLRLGFGLRGLRREKR